MASKSRWFGISIIVFAILAVYVGGYFVLTEKSMSLGMGASPSAERFIRYDWMPDWLIYLYRPLIAIEENLTGETIHEAYLIQ